MVRARLRRKRGEVVGVFGIFGGEVVLVVANSGNVRESHWGRIPIY